MTIEKTKKAGEICFWIALFIELLLVLIDKSAYINPYEGMLFRVTFILFGIKIITTDYSIKEWIIIAIVGGIVSISYLVNTKDEAVRAVAFIIACKNIELDKILKVVFFTTLAGIIILFLLSITGIYGSIAMTANFGRGDTAAGSIETRYCFGMGHPNAFQTMVLMTSLLFVTLYEKNLKLYYLVLITLINYVSYIFTDSNTAMLIWFASLVGIVVLKYCRIIRECKLIYILSNVLIVLLTAFSAYGVQVGHNGKYMWELDRKLNGRFKYSHIYEMARVENWRLFADSTNVEYFDQGYARLFYWYGIIPAVLFLLMMMYLVWQSYKKENYTLLIMVVANAVFMLMEAHIVSIYLLRNYLLIFMGYYWNKCLADNKKEYGILSLLEKR